MHRLTHVAILSSFLVLSLACGDDDGSAADGSVSGDGGGFDGSTPDGSTGMDADTVDTGVIVLPDGNVILPDGAVPDGSMPGCRPVTCGGMQYLCGNCMDDDGDGLADADDPDCVGACDNNEAGYDLGIPGGEVGRCERDCYYDTNQGPGNDGCDWNIRCDETLSPSVTCSGGGGGACPETQSELCVDTCAAVTPNGCDCFGCCELPALSGNFVFLGSTVGGEPSCTFADVEDPSKCFPCEPVGGRGGDNACYNACGRCELCLGRDPATIPADCFPPPPTDAGMPDSGGVDGGPPVDAGTPPLPTCEDGRQACGLPGLSPCPDNYYCLTGCCTEFF